LTLTVDWRRVLRGYRAFAPLVAVLCLVAPAYAETTVQDGDRATQAIELGEQGLELFEQGRWQEALERFQAAEAAYHSPVFVLFSARCLRNSGRLLDAEREFRRLGETPISQSAPTPWLDAQRDGRAELLALERQIPALVVVVENASSDAVVTIDGKRVVGAEPVRLDPGSHLVQVSDGAFAESKTVTLKAATLHSMRVRVAVRAEPSEQPKEADHRESSTGAWALVGTGAAVTITGGVLGFLALGRAGDVRSTISRACEGQTCPDSRRPDLESEIGNVERRGAVAVALVSAGAVTTVIGLFLLPSVQPATGANTHGLLLRF
jgi:hypothetical protein